MVKTATSPMVTSAREAGGSVSRPLFRSVCKNYINLSCATPVPVFTESENASEPRSHSNNIKGSSSHERTSTSFRTLWVSRCKWTRAEFRYPQNSIFADVGSFLLLTIYKINRRNPASFRVERRREIKFYDLKEGLTDKLRPMQSYKEESNIGPLHCYHA